MNQYTPDTVTPPGDTLRDTLALLGMSRAICAVLAGCSEATIDALITGDAHITDEIAHGLERATGISAQWWIRRERAYRDAR